MKKLIVMIVMAMFSIATFATPGSPKAVKGGVMYDSLYSAPTTLNPLTSTDYSASIVQGYILEGLCNINPDTYEYEPGLAESWEASKDGMTFTFKIREGVKWHDGKPFTVEDVKFSFDIIFKDDYKTAHMRPYFENVKEAKILDERTIQFTMKKKYFNSMATLASGGYMAIIPKHLYDKPSKKIKKKLNKTLVGTGPYMLGKYQRGKKLELKRNTNWWGDKDPLQVGVHNPKKILFKFVNDENIQIEMVKKGDLDFTSISSENYMKKTKGDKWGKDAFAVQIQNEGPKGYGYIGLNLEKPLFKSKDVRLALYHLLNRELMIKKFLFNLSLPATGPWYQQSPYASKNIRPVSFNPKKALEILRKEGWADTDKDGILDKTIDGKKVKFSFTLMEPSKEFMKYLTIFKEDAKKMGVDVNLKFVEWQTFLKLVREGNFDAYRSGWSGGSVDLDPKQIWHSASANGGSNYVKYKNPKVDALIDKGRKELNKKKRVRIFQEVYEKIADDVPYLFLFNRKFDHYIHTKRMKRVKDTYRFDVGKTYWWIDPV